MEHRVGNYEENASSVCQRNWRFLPSRPPCHDEEVETKWQVRDYYEKGKARSLFRTGNCKSFCKCVSHASSRADYETYDGMLNRKFRVSRVSPSQSFPKRPILHCILQAILQAMPAVVLRVNRRP